ncbi:MAG: VapE domain-containing protein [Pseudomonadota bacterium]
MASKEATDSSTKHNIGENNHQTLIDLSTLPIWAARGAPEAVVKSKRAPINPKTGRSAKNDTPDTWADRDRAEKHAANVPSEREPGVGLMLGAIHAPDGWCRAGLDLDGCRDPDTGELESWAEQIVYRFDTLTEASPSGTGLHVLFHARIADVESLREDGLIAKVGRSFLRGNHLEIAAFFGGKFLTVTEEYYDEGDIGLSDTIRPVPLANLQWLLGEYAPAWAGTDENGDGMDESGSGHAWRRVCMLVGNGLDDCEIVQELAREDSPAGEWWARAPERERARTIFRAREQVKPSIDLGLLLDDLPELPTASSPPVMRKKNGEPEATAHNAVIYLDRANRTSELAIRHNALTGQDEWRAGEVRDADLTRIRVEVERAGMRNIGHDLTVRAVRAISERNAYHPVRDWLGGLVHDGRPRLDTWLSDYLGVEDSRYVRAVGRASVIGLVARVMRPGCKHDHVLTLTGAQGAGKSTVCRILGGPWYGDNLSSLARDDTEASRWLRGHWLVELSEMAPTRKAEAETLKSFLSRATDNVRAPYGRLAESIPRQCAFIATTNDEQFLRDPTGGRRFWPVSVSAEIDTEGLTRDRDQLFAEALAAFGAGEAWHLDQETEALAREVQAAATEEDPWATLLSDYLDGTLDEDGQPLDYVHTAEVLAAIDLPTGQKGGAAGKRAAAILQQMGLSPVRSKQGRFWKRPQ